MRVWNPSLSSSPMKLCTWLKAPAAVMSMRNIWYWCSPTSTVAHGSVARGTAVTSCLLARLRIMLTTSVLSIPVGKAAASTARRSSASASCPSSPGAASGIPAMVWLISASCAASAWCSRRSSL